MLTVGRSDVSLQRPTSTNTTIANHGRHQRKWPPSAPHEAKLALRANALNWWKTTSQGSGYSFGGCWWCVWPSNTPILWKCIIAGTKEPFEGHTHPQPPQNTLGGLSHIHSKHLCRAQGLMWGARGPFPPAAAMAVVVVMPVVFFAKATEKCNKNTKISCL